MLHFYEGKRLQTVFNETTVEQNWVSHFLCSNYEKWRCVRLDVVETCRVFDEFRQMFSSLAHA